MKPTPKWMAKDILAKTDARMKTKPITDIYNQLDDEIKYHASNEIMSMEQCEMFEQFESWHDGMSTSAIFIMA